MSCEEFESDPWLSASFTETGAVEALEPIRQRYNAQHYNLRKFYYECSNLKYLTTLITVPKLPRVSAKYLPN